MARHTLEFAAKHNRMTERGHERLCIRGDHWVPIEQMKLTRHIRGYICYGCECERQKARNRSTESRRRERLKCQQFDETGVHVYGLMVFASMPTPEQLMERQAA